MNPLSTVIVSRLKYMTFAHIVVEITNQFVIYFILQLFIIDKEDTCIKCCSTLSHLFNTFLDVFMGYLIYYLKQLLKDVVKCYITSIPIKKDTSG